MNNNKNKQFKIAHWNCTYSRNKISLIEQFLNKNNPDILMLNEIKCNKAQADMFPNFDGYINVNECRNEYGGGVAMLIKNSINFQRIYDFKHLNLELIAIETKINNQNTIIISWYNPDKDIKRELFELAIKTKKNIIIGGDLNAKNIEFGCKTNNESGIELNNIIEDYNLILANNTNTTYTEIRSPNDDDYHEILDVFICSLNINQSKVFEFSKVAF